MVFCDSHLVVRNQADSRRSGCRSHPHARALPLYQTTSYTFNDTTHAANLFGLKELGNIYTRIMNPTQAAVEERIAALEGGVGALLLASGQAAETIAILNLAQAGDHIVSSPSLYGGTYNLFHYTLPRLGIEVSFVANPDDPQSWRDAVRPNTKAFFGESIANPKSDILDIEAVAAVAHELGVPLIVDNTVATPYLIRPIECGADIVIHSVTKYIGGHGTAIGGVIVDSGRFDYGAHPERFPNFNQPDPSYHGLVYARDLGMNGVLGANLAFILKARVQLLRDLGASIAPFNAWLVALGLETLSLRIERHTSNALAVARWLEARPEVVSVNYAGLESSPWHERGRKYAHRAHPGDEPVRSGAGARWHRSGSGAHHSVADHGRGRQRPSVSAGAAATHRQPRSRRWPAASDPQSARP
jgi:O-acetylhomoserine (thiol)-lyase